jgi:hypothetical protein
MFAFLQPEVVRAQIQLIAGVRHGDGCLVRKMAVGRNSRVMACNGRFPRRFPDRQIIVKGRKKVPFVPYVPICPTCPICPICPYVPFVPNVPLVPAINKVSSMIKLELAV